MFLTGIGASRENAKEDVLAPSSWESSSISHAYEVTTEQHVILQKKPEFQITASKRNHIW